jgi:hypothetical protein
MKYRSEIIWSRFFYAINYPLVGANLRVRPIRIERENSFRVKDLSNPLRNDNC